VINSGEFPNRSSHGAGFRIIAAGDRLNVPVLSLLDFKSNLRGLSQWIDKFSSSSVVGVLKLNDKVF
jgi:hypothetical protein